MMTLIILIWKTKKEKLGSKWGEMMSTRRNRLCGFGRRNKALKEQTNSENKDSKDSLQDKEKNLEDLKDKHYHCVWANSRLKD